MMLLDEIRKQEQEATLTALQVMATADAYDQYDNLLLSRDQADGLRAYVIRLTERYRKEYLV